MPHWLTGQKTQPVNRSQSLHFIHQLIETQISGSSMHNKSCQVYPCTHGLAWAKNPRVCILSQSTNGRNRCRDENSEASFQSFILNLTHWEFGCAAEGICRMSSFLFTLLCCCQATETSQVSQSPKGEVVLFSYRLCCVPAVGCQ